MDVQLGTNNQGAYTPLTTTLDKPEGQEGIQTPITSKTLQTESVSAATNNDAAVTVPAPSLSGPPKLTPPTSDGLNPNVMDKISDALDTKTASYLEKNGVNPSMLGMMGQGTTSGDLNATMTHILGHQQVLGSGQPQQNTTDANTKPEENVPLPSDEDVVQYAQQTGMSPDEAAKKIKQSLGPLDANSAAKLLTALNDEEKRSGSDGVDIDKSPEFRELRKNSMNTMLEDVKFTQPSGNLKLPLSPDQKRDLEEYVNAFLKDPNTPVPESLKNVTPSVAATVKTVNAAVLSGIQSEMTTISTSPSFIQTVNILGLGSASSAKASTDIAQEMVDKQKALLDSMPDFPGKAGMLSYLGTINEAINSIREMLQKVTEAQAESSRNVNSMLYKETMLIFNNQTETQDRINADIAAKSKTQTKGQKAMHGLKKFGEVFTKILVVAAACVVAAFLSSIMPPLGLVLGAAVIAMAIVYVCPSENQIHDKNMKWIGKLHDKQDKAIKDGSKAIAKGSVKICELIFDKGLHTGIGKEIGGAVAIVANTIFATIMSGGNPLMFADLYTKPNGPLDASLLACDAYGNPVDEKARMITLMTVGIVIQVVIMIVIIAATMGAGSGAVVAEAAGEAAAVTAEATATAAEAAAVTAEATATAAEATATAAEATATAAEVSAAAAETSATAAETAAASGETAAEIAEAAANVAEKGAETAQKSTSVVNAIKHTATAANVGATVSSSTTTIIQSIITKKMEEIQQMIIREKAKLEKLDEIIAELKQMLTKLVESINGIVAEDPNVILFFNKSQKEITDKLSEAVGMVTGAA